jgi:hypothetical protein
MPSQRFGGLRPIKRVLIANNGIGAVKCIRYVVRITAAENKLNRNEMFSAPRT